MYGIDLGGYVMTLDGPAWIMRSRSARWFMWRVRMLVTDPSSRFHAVIDKRRKDQQAAPAPAAPGDEDY